MRVPSHFKRSATQAPYTWADAAHAQSLQHSVFALSRVQHTHNGEEPFVVDILLVIYASAEGHGLQQKRMQNTETFSFGEVKGKVNHNTASLLVGC